MSNTRRGKRIVIKIGTGVLTRGKGGHIHHAMIARLSQAISDVHTAGHEVIIVSSGAVGAGLEAFGLEKRPDQTQMKLLQACAAAGQAHLMHLYDSQFGLNGLKVAQLLVTHEDLKGEISSQSVLGTLNTILEHRGIIPILNENDSVAIDEMIGDNDVLSSILARLVQADMLMLLTSVNGLQASDSTIIPFVEHISEVLTCVRDEKGENSRGGMDSKLRAAQAAADAGIETLIANGNNPEQLLDLVNGDGIATRFRIRSPHSPQTISDSAAALS